MSSRHGGFSLVDMVLVIVLTAVAIASLMPVLSESLQRHTEIQRVNQASELAADLMEEIRATVYEDPESATASFGTEEAGRSLYDDCDDYDGLSDSPPHAKDGTVLAGYTGFTRSVIVENVAESAYDGAAQADGSTRVKRITVTVTRNGRSLVLKGIRGRL